MGRHFVRLSCARARTRTTHARISKCMCNAVVPRFVPDRYPRVIVLIRVTGYIELCFTARDDRRPTLFSLSFSLVLLPFSLCPFLRARDIFFLFSLHQEEYRTLALWMDTLRTYQITLYAYKTCIDIPHVPVSLQNLYSILLREVHIELSLSFNKKKMDRDDIRFVPCS